MARTKRKVSSSAAKTKARETAIKKARIQREIAAIVCIAFGAFLAFALLFGDAGIVGAALAYALPGIFGKMANALPFFLIAFGIFLFLAVKRRINSLPIILLSVVFVMFCVLFAIKPVEAGYFNGIGGFGDVLRSFGEIFEDTKAERAGGIIGMFAALGLVKALGGVGARILCIAVIAIAALLLGGVPASQIAGRAREKAEAIKDAREEKRAERESLYVDENAETEVTAKGQETASDGVPSRGGAGKGFALGLAGLPSFIAGMLGGKKTDEAGDVDVQGEDGGAVRAKVATGLDSSDEQRAMGAFAGGGAAGKKESSVNLSRNTGQHRQVGVKGASVAAPASATMAVKKEIFMDDSGYELPSLDLLSKPKTAANLGSDIATAAGREKLERALSDFRVDAKVVNVTIGPTVTRYEVEPDAGVRIQDIRRLEPDLALKLEVKSVRVVPMPGQRVVGIEAYNSNRNIVALRDIVDSEEFRSGESMTSFALGKNISGKRIVADLSKMPHLLIAGTTGSGKSVCINCILLSLLYRAKPSELKLILIDPKVVELKSYNDIPHLLVPVVTSPERAAVALSYAVNLMDERYKKFSAEGVRNLDGFNEKMAKEGRTEEILPQIVIVIDELSDLMLVAAAKVQESISRLAAMARAAGMHLIVATQQPLASILTSVIKANIPSRIAFSVSSNSASRVILDTPGAERLHGNGDMLFAPIGEREPMRVQGAFVSDSEVQKITNFIKKQKPPEYSEEFVQTMETGNLQEAAERGEPDDELFADAVELVAETKKASVSMIQRRFRIGYNRAARIVDMMEECGIVSASEGENKPRRVIMTDEQLKGYMQRGGAVPRNDGTDDVPDEVQEDVPAINDEAVEAEPEQMTFTYEPETEKQDEREATGLPRRDEVAPRNDESDETSNAARNDESDDDGDVDFAEIFGKN